MKNNIKYWKKFYSKNSRLKHSSFAVWALPKLGSPLIELGCGNGRDLEYFLDKGLRAYGVDSAFSDDYIVKQDVVAYMKKNKSPAYVYTRFFWHAIDRTLQLKILNWTSGYLFIEARTTKDKDRKKIHGQHQRNYVSVEQLFADFAEFGFEVLDYKEGTGLSPYKGEDPYLIRVIVKKI